MRLLIHAVKKAYRYYRVQASLCEGICAMDDSSDRNIDDLKRRRSDLDDPEKLEKIENLCRLLMGRFEGTRKV